MEQPTAAKPPYIVYVSDTIRGASEVRYYRTQSAARKRYDFLCRTLKRNGHNGVMVGRLDPTAGVYLAIVSG